jgi:hypothetical protein
VFASLAALGAGLEVTVEAVSHRIDASDTAVAFATAVPVSVFLIVVWALHAPLAATPTRGLVRLGPAVLALLLVAALVPVGLPLAWAVLLLCLPPAVLVVGHHRWAWGEEGRGATVSPT